jgi:hypothetical protein
MIIYPNDTNKEYLTVGPFDSAEAFNAYVNKHKDEIAPFSWEQLWIVSPDASLAAELTELRDDAEA